MAKFLVSEDEEGERPSNPRQKRRRIIVRSTTSEEHEPEDIEDRSGAEEDEDDGEESDGEREDELESEDDEEESDEDFDEDEQDLSRIFGPTSNVSNQVGTRCTEPSRDVSISVSLTDPEVLDCCICYEPLSIPVFQCETGHIACSSCCIKLSNKCALCSWPIGYNRCLAIEKVLESIKISCQNTKYGCKETVTYSKKNDHENTCNYVPCSCPHSDCNFVAPVKVLYPHFSLKHKKSAESFIFNCSFQVCLSDNQQYLILQEQNEGALFVLYNKVELLGNTVTVSSVGPCSSKAGAYYDLMVKSQGNCLRLQSFSKSTQSRVAYHLTGFLLIPSDFFDSCGQLKLNLCIYRSVTNPAYIQRGLGGALR
ncbi:E3 ubiquitin-protein ligase [Quillaja saponaria]|uniref:RING-type E3 ubiquitin transferase n=1 Tax=Quillaja saponaria TaxID=32244 RepID=A0AAD7PXY9_QUISA|nr:E3 ubiquitin-protein ligase [Quillaja saponaria]